MRDAATGEMIWQQHWPPHWRDEEVVACIPKRVMKCKAVSRELNFSSKQAIQDLWMVQQVFVGDVCIEEWVFQFGFVIPDSTNSWQSTIEAADETEMLDPDQISGLVRIKTSFKDGETVINSSEVRVYYD
eukprot:CAMPEP_0114230894 /NCGR_PEP_ID=MMETSP0058-20121206/3728_1 /TAXON_ID=36894 /ORGANISM="Pyramimonas parkeae, CCMP726" /LENGTH=129 /DNA_ID=CAMNT_0001342155 /DNA_START=218 /DNA_END=607 /DNA_ORIENTATION=-